MNDKLKQLEQELEAEALRINAGRKPKFGDLMRNPWASESNPIRDGYFVRKCGAGVDAYYEFTNGEGKFWKTRARFAFFIEAARATPAQPVATVIKRGAERTFMSENMGKLLDGTYSLYLHPEPSPSSVGAAIRALPLPAPVEEVQAWFRGEWDYTRVNGNYYTAGQIIRLLSEAAALAEQVQGQHALYEQLLMAVARKYPGESRHETALKYIQRAESEKPFVPDGWKLVPVEPTDEMRIACVYGGDADEIDEDWKAMLAAAPSIAQDGQKSEAK